MTDNNGNDSRYGARPLETHQGGRVPGPVPQRGSYHATGGPRSPFCGGARRRVRRVNATGYDRNEDVEPRPLRVLQWNAEGISKKKLPFAERLHKEDIDIACIQETHLTENLRFTIRGYQTYRADREKRHKGGVLILIKNHLPAKHITLDTDGQAEITGVDITLQNGKQIRIYNIYCPADRQLSLHKMEVPQDGCLIIGDFNSHSHSWGYNETDSRGEEVEDWQIEQHLYLLNSPEDPPTFYSRRWMTSTTPDLSFSTNNLQTSAERTVLDQLAGSDHKPVKLTFNLNHHPGDCKPLPRWNYKKAKWEDYSMLTDEYVANINTRRKDANSMTKAFNAAVLKAAKETIPRGARKNYKPYWTEELQKLEDQVNDAREKVEKEPTIENNISLKEKTASYKKTFTQAARNNWKRKTESLNLDKDGSKLWNLAKAMNDEKSTPAPIRLEQNGETITGKKAADHLISSFERNSNLDIP
ncbi:hypothetical protein V1264_009008 [Littorina saxatilis]|uniref:Endonuclease/exonuclease/phosphatase domain-containing protein n=1 Tax=Littorina saxatilis TaxID=31220 RepID=A0AAN9G0W4_9CAEN